MYTYSITIANIVDADTIAEQICVNKPDRTGTQQPRVMALMHVRTSDKFAISTRARARLRRLKVSAAVRPKAS